MIYNLECKVLDKLGRAKKTFHGGIFSSEDALQLGKEKVLEDSKDVSLRFEVYIIDSPVFTPLQNTIQ